MCQDWRNEIDDLVEFIVKIDDSKPYWERILQLRIKSCEIIQFLKPPPQGLGTTCLKYPNLIRTLKILTNRISPNNFFYLLSDCSANLRQFALKLSFPLLASQFPATFSLFNFEQLKELEINVSTIPPFLSDEAQLHFHEYRRDNQEVLFTQFICNPMRSLKHLKIELQVLGSSQVSKFTALVLRFMYSHWKILETFDFELIQGHHGIPSSEAQDLNESDQETLDLKALDRVSNLKALRLVSSSAIGVNIWIGVMENQNNLEFFEVDILPAHNSVFRTIIAKNFKTLRILEITDLTVWNQDGEPEPFDVSILESCSSLKKLVLDRNVASTRRAYDCAELINLFQIPSTLNELALNYFNVLSEDLFLLASAEAGRNLRNLTLTQCGNSGPFGVTGTVLESIISLESITFIEISIMNFSDPDERLKLNSILMSYGYGEDHSYFQLSKLTSLIQGLLSLGQNEAEGDDSY